jgi:hypothetical protein
MARAAISQYTGDYNGTAATVTTIGADGVKVPFNVNNRYIINNPTGGAINAVFGTPATPGGQTLGDNTVSIGAGVTMVYKGLELEYYRQSDGMVYLDGQNLTVFVVL